MKTETARLFIRKAIIAFLIAILVVAGSLSVYGWFSKNREVDNRDFEFGLDTDNAVAEYKVYKHDLAIDKGTTLVIDQKTGTPVQVDGKDQIITLDNIDLNQYDTIFTKRNRYTPAFVQIKLTRAGVNPPPNGTIDVEITRDDDVKYFIENSDGTKTEVEQGTAGAVATDCATQVMRYTVMLDKVGEEPDQVGTGTKKNSEVTTTEIAEYEAMDDDTMYNYIDAKLYETVSGYTCTTANANNLDNSKTFYTAISKNDEDAASHYTYTYSDDNKIMLSVPYTVDDWSPAIDDEGEEVQVIYLYVYLTYDTGLIECYKEENNLSAISIGRDFVDFENNLKKIKVSFGS